MTLPAHVLLLTGAPGVGKTTAVRAVAASLTGRRLGGFLTEEIRAGGARQGFELVTFDGRRAVMAHVDHPGPVRVGRYGIDVAVIETLARSALAVGDDVVVYLVDEIGKMECLSAAFVGATRALLDAGVLVLATIAQRGSGFIAEVKERPDVALWTVTRANRDEIPARVRAWIDERVRSVP